MSLKRKLVAGAGALFLAGGAAGAGLAASGHGTSRHVVRHVQLKSTTEAAFIRASAVYLGTDAATLRREVKGGRTLADVADSTPGRSAKQLTRLLVAAAATRLGQVSDRSLSPSQQTVLHALLRRRVTGFLNDTCPLGLAGLGKHLGGCKGMSM
jgi:hypothetical protein